VTGRALEADRDRRLGVAPTPDLVRRVDPLARRVVGQEQRVADPLGVHGGGQVVDPGDGHGLVGRRRGGGVGDDAVEGVLELLEDGDLVVPGWTNTVPCSAAGMFHSRPWNTSVSRTASRAARMSGFTFSTPILACWALPWSAQVQRRWQVGVVMVMVVVRVSVAHLGFLRFRLARSQRQSRLSGRTGHDVTAARRRTCEDTPCCAAFRSHVATEPVVSPRPRKYVRPIARG
jgi:hypothetical protein